MADVNNEVKIKVTLDSQEAEAKLAELYQKAQNLVNNATANQSGGGQGGGGGGIPPSGNGGGGDSPSEEQRQQRRQRRNAEEFNRVLNRNAQLFGALVSSSFVNKLGSDLAGIYFSGQRHAGVSNFAVDKAESGFNSALGYGSAGLALGGMIAGPIGAAVGGAVGAVVGKFMSDAKVEEKARLQAEQVSSDLRKAGYRGELGLLRGTREDMFSAKQSTILDFDDKIKSLEEDIQKMDDSAQHSGKMMEMYAGGEKEKAIDLYGTDDQRKWKRERKAELDELAKKVEEKRNEAYSSSTMYAFGGPGMGVLMREAAVQPFLESYQKALAAYNRDFVDRDTKSEGYFKLAIGNSDAIASKFSKSKELMDMFRVKGMVNAIKPLEGTEFGDAYSRMGVSMGGTIDMQRANDPIIENLVSMQSGITRIVDMIDGYLNSKDFSKESEIAVREAMRTWSSTYVD